MAVPRLPDELIALIVEHLVGLYDEKGRDDDGNRREAALASCCRVGRAFLPPARASLYQRFSIGFEPSREEERGVEGVDEDVAADVLQCAWSTERAYGLAMNPHLGLLIRKLDLNVDFRQSDSVDEYAPALALATALRSAPRVVGIRLAATWGEFASSYFPPLFDVLIKVRPSLRRLDLDWSRFEDDVPAPQIPGIYPLLAALPLLEFLTLDQVHLPNLPVTFVAPFSLKYLSITNITGPALAAAFSSLTSNSSASLERLVTDGLTKFDLSPFSALNHFDVILAIDAQDFDDPANFEREAHHIARDNVGGMLASAKPSLCVVEIIDGGRVMPASAFNGAFFSSFPRTVVNLVMEDLAFETAALERLLERRPRALPRLSLLVVQGELWKAGPEEPWAANFRAAEVLLAFAGENMLNDLDFLNSLSLNPTSPASTDPTSTTSSTFPEFSPFSDLPTTATGEIDLSALDEADAEDLLRRLEEAESAADGLEGRLDSLIGTLDSMLGVLEEGEDDAGAVGDEERLGSDGAQGKPNGEVAGVEEMASENGKA